MKTNMNMMKSILMVLVVGALVCSSCDDGDDETPPCNCFTAYGSTAHLAIDEACKCGGTECHCTEQKTTVEGTTIPIRKEAGVTVQQMNDAVANINTSVYDKGFTSGNINNFKNHITAIQIISGSEVTHTGTTLKVGCGATIEEIFDYIADHVIAQIQPKTAPGVILAFQSPAGSLVTQKERILGQNITYRAIKLPYEAIKLPNFG